MRTLLRLMQKVKSGFEFEHWLAEFVGVFFDRAQVGPAMMTAQRLRALVGGNWFFRKP